MLSGALDLLSCTGNNHSQRDAHEFKADIMIQNATATHKIMHGAEMHPNAHAGKHNNHT